MWEQPYIVFERQLLMGEWRECSSITLKCNTHSLIGLCMVHVQEICLHKLLELFTDIMYCWLHNINIVTAGELNFINILPPNIQLFGRNIFFILQYPNILMILVILAILRWWVTRNINIYLYSFTSQIWPTQCND